jgi:hypothetical protein
VIVKDQRMSLQISSLKTPIGRLNLIADGEVLLGANFSSIKALKESVDQSYLGSEFNLGEKASRHLTAYR